MDMWQLYIYLIFNIFINLIYNIQFKVNQMLTRGIYTNK